MCERQNKRHLSGQEQFGHLHTADSCSQGFKSIEIVRRLNTDRTASPSVVEGVVVMRVVVTVVVLVLGSVVENSRKI